MSSSNIAAAQPSMAPSQVGGYRVIRRLANGGSSDVFLAHAEGSRKPEGMVALKVLLPGVENPKNPARIFSEQASAYAKLRHPAIVELYDSFVTDGQFVLVMEYAHGLSLNHLRALLHAAGDKLDDRASILIASRIFSALAAAHDPKASPPEPRPGPSAAPVVHGGVNPSNVLLSWEGHVRLADFGTAKVVGFQ